MAQVVRGYHRKGTRCTTQRHLLATRESFDNSEEGSSDKESNGEAEVQVQPTTRSTTTSIQGLRSSTRNRRPPERQSYGNNFIEGACRGLSNWVLSYYGILFFFYSCKERKLCWQTNVVWSRHVPCLNLSARMLCEHLVYLPFLFTPLNTDSE